jgi:hypothetical protein
MDVWISYDDDGVGIGNATSLAAEACEKTLLLTYLVLLGRKQGEVCLVMSLFVVLKGGWLVV